MALEEEEGLPTTLTFCEKPIAEQISNANTEKKYFIINYFICKLLIKKLINKENVKNKE